MRAGLDPSDIFEIDDADKELMQLRIETFNADNRHDAENVVDGNHEIEEHIEMEGVHGPTSPTFNAEECDGDAHDDHDHDPEDCKSDCPNSGYNHKVITNVGDRGTLDHSKLQCIEQNPFIVHDAANLLPVR